MQDRKKTEPAEKSADSRHSVAASNAKAYTASLDEADDLTEAEFTEQLARIMAAGALQAVRGRAEGEGGGAGRAAADSVA